MTRLFTTAACLLALSAAPAAGPLTAAERQRLVAHFEMTEAWLVSELNGNDRKHQHGW
jgi:hypothetical protein